MLQLKISSHNRTVDFVVTIFLINQARVLLVDHKKIKSWLPIGGHIESYEDPIQALYREIKEETGLNPDQIKLTESIQGILTPRTKPLYSPTFLDIHHIESNHYHVGMNYSGYCLTDKIKLSKEHHAIGWFNIDQIDVLLYQQKIFEEIAHYSKTILLEGQQA